MANTVPSVLQFLLGATASFIGRLVCSVTEVLPFTQTTMTWIFDVVKTSNLEVLLVQSQSLRAEIS